MSDSVFSREQLLADYRTRSSHYEFESAPKPMLDQRLAEGWEVVRENKSNIRLRRHKSHSRYFEDRVWTLMYQMGFLKLSSNKGLLLPTPSGGSGPAGTNQIDVVAMDDETALAIECKSQEVLSKRSQLESEIGKLHNLQQRFTHFARNDDGGKVRRTIGLVIAVNNVVLKDADYERAAEQKIVLLDSKDIAYFEELTKHLGFAARYQFLADVLSSRKIPELSITVPAIRSKMGKETAYSFSISPEYLLKIAYVSHRSKGRASDVNTYQRMVKKSRLNSIRKYIDEESNIFPTNIVISLDDKVRFDLGKNEAGTKDDLGWLHLDPRYKSAWIIDGQHRLFAYSGSPRASTSRLSILAFEQLSPSMQAQLFIDINAEQKAVKKDLLHELFAELHWNSEDSESRTKAVITKAIQRMDQDPDSPFYGRIIAAEGGRNTDRCISLTNVFRALHQPELYMGSARNRQIEVPGILWAKDNDSMVGRSATILNSWFEAIRELNREWWDLGSAPGGGLAMNDSIAALTMVLRSVAEFYVKSGNDLSKVSDEEAAGKIRPIAKIAGEFLAAYTDEERLRYRELRGGQGQTTRMRRVQSAIRQKLPTFNPAGLEKFLEEEAAETNTRSREIVDRMERLIQETVLNELKRFYGEEGDSWWTDGIPSSVRVAAAKLREEDNNARGGAHYYFNLIDYRRIVVDNWTLFEPMFGFGKSGNKDARTKWMVNLNEVRKIVSHASTGRTVSLEELEQIQGYEEELRSKLSMAEGEFD